MTTGAEGQVFFVATRGYRNWRTFQTLAFIVLFAFFPTGAMIRGAPPGNYSGPGFIMGTVFSLAFIAIFLKTLYNVVADVRHNARVDSAGVTLPGGRFKPWAEIASIGIARVSSLDNDGFLFVKLRGNRVGLRGAALAWSVTHRLRGDRPLAPEEYLPGFARLEPYLREHYPDVTVSIPRG